MCFQSLLLNIYLFPATDSPTLPWFYLAPVAALNMLGYVMYRTSDTQRCEHARNPGQPGLRNLRSIPAAAGRRILCGGWWGLVRRPDYLGQILVQWSWILPAGEGLTRCLHKCVYVSTSTTLSLL